MHPEITRTLVAQHHDELVRDAAVPIHRDVLARTLPASMLSAADAV